MEDTKTKHLQSGFSRWALFVLGSALLLFLPESTLGQPGSSGGRQRSVEEQLSLLQEQLGLSDEQVTQLKPVLEENRSKMQALRERFQNQERSQSSFRAMRGEMQRLRKEHEKALEKVLTEDQMKEYRKLRAERQRGGRGGGQGGRGRRPSQY